MNNTEYRIGTLDLISNNQIMGWAWNKYTRETVIIEIIIDGNVIGQTTADSYRLDLELASIANGYAGFSYIIPDDLCDNKKHKIEARILGTSIYLNGSPKNILLNKYNDSVEYFKNSTWIDKDDNIFEEDLTIKSKFIPKNQIQNILDFRRDGFIKFNSIIDERLILQVERDIERLWRERPYLLTQAAGEPIPTPLSSILNEEEYRLKSARYLDFHNISEAAAEILCHPFIVDFVELYLGESIAGMQTLLFEHGTQQNAHQDYPYVHSLRPSAIAGVWIALEDVSEDAGPLFYYRGSHKVIKPYLFENGSILAHGDGAHIRKYENYLQEECELNGLKKEYLIAKKGDVLVWHSALVHGGGFRKNIKLTRRSLVSHYTTLNAYPTDRRFPSLQPIPKKINNCTYYENQSKGHIEGLFKAS